MAWIESSEVGTDYDSPMEFIMLEKFLASLSTILQTFVKEQLPKTLVTAVKLAHNAYSKTSISSFSSKKSKSARHFSHRKTEMKVMEHFYRPGMGADN